MKIRGNYFIIFIIFLLYLWMCVCVYLLFEWFLKTSWQTFTLLNSHWLACSLSHLLVILWLSIYSTFFFVFYLYSLIFYIFFFTLSYIFKVRDRFLAFSRHCNFINITYRKFIIKNKLNYRKESTQFWLTILFSFIIFNRKTCWIKFS